jgi:hypothetical protein
LPTPLSPVIRTLPSDAATRDAVAMSAIICGLATMSELDSGALKPDRNTSPDILWIPLTYDNEWELLARKCRLAGLRQDRLRFSDLDLWPEIRDAEN